MTRVEKAAELHLSGYNCAQAVAMAFADVVGMSEEELCRISEGFGAGGGGMLGTCGAVAGAQMILGLLTNKDGKSSSTKGQTYKKTRALMETFKNKNGSVICGELKGIGTGKVLRGCHDCVMDAAEILEQMLEEQ